MANLLFINCNIFNYSTKVIKISELQKNKVEIFDTKERV